MHPPNRVRVIKVRTFQRGGTPDRAVGKEYQRVQTGPPMKCLFNFMGEPSDTGGAGVFSVYGLGGNRRPVRFARAQVRHVLREGVDV